MAEVQGKQREAARPTIRDPGIMRALAHPARLTIMQHLSGGRVATATECAQVCGLSPSATSYHLRALAKAGLIEEAPSRGDGRERVWRSPMAQFDIGAERGAPEDVHLAERELVEAVLAQQAAQVRRWLDVAKDEPEEWYTVSVMHQTQLTLTPAELAELNEAVFALMTPYRERTEPPEGARRVSVAYRALPSG
jgi:DNA-binding transcriptional ArsR family regulator